MPLYEYQCEECSHYFTRQLKIAQMLDPEKESCSSCGKSAVKKKILSGITFNADTLKQHTGYRDLVRQWRKDFPGNTLPDL